MLPTNLHDIMRRRVFPANRPWLGGMPYVPWPQLSTKTLLVPPADANATAIIDHASKYMGIMFFEGLPQRYLHGVYLGSVLPGSNFLNWRGVRKGGRGCMFESVPRRPKRGGSKMEMQRKQISYMHELATAARSALVGPIMCGSRKGGGFTEELISVSQFEKGGWRSGLPGH